MILSTMKRDSLYNQSMRRGPKYGGRSKSVVINMDNDHDDTITAMAPPRKPKTFLTYLHELEHNKACVREHALSSIIRILNEGKECGTLEEHSATTLYHILGLIKRGSAKEKELASQVLGLMAMTLSGTDNAHEIYKETVPVIKEVLTTKVVDPWVFINLLNSLAMVTFFCANDALETQATMQIIWNFILPESELDVPVKNQVPIIISAPIISAAISAWSFLITTVDGWELNYHWDGAITVFLNMLDSDDDSVCVSVAEAFAVIFDSDNIDKFFKAQTTLNYSDLKRWIKNVVLWQLEMVSEASSGIYLEKADWDVLKYFKDGIFPQTSETINGNKLTISSWSSMIQFKFLKKFIGEEEFSKHMLENGLFHHLFEFTPNHQKNDISCLYESTMVKIKSTVYLPEEQDPELETSKKKKQERHRRHSITDKSKTKVLNKRRMFAEERKGKVYQVESEM